MGIAAMVIGIVALIVGFIPLCGFAALIPAIVGLVLAIVDVSIKAKKQEPKGCGIAGIVLNAVTIVIIMVWGVCFAQAAVGVGKAIENANKGTVVEETVITTEETSPVVPASAAAEKPAAAPAK